MSTWLTNANANNMANMLSVQLAATELNVRHGYVNGNAYVDVNAISGSFNTLGGNLHTILQSHGLADSNGSVNINALMAAANTNLGSNFSTLAGNADTRLPRGTQGRIRRHQQQPEYLRGLIHEGRLG